MMKTISLIPALLLLAGLLQACGGSSSSGCACEPPPAAPADPDPAADLSHTPLQMPRGDAGQSGGTLISSIGQNQVQALAGNPAMVFEVVENHSEDTGENCAELGAQYSSCSVVNLHIKDSAAALDGNDWKLYFHSIRRVLRVDSDEFNVFHINGDLHFIAPDANYSGFGNTTVKTIKLVTEFSHLHESDFMPRYWLSRAGQAAQLLANSDHDSDSSGYAVAISGDNRKAFNSEPTPLADSINRHEHNSDTTELPDVDALIVPSPESIVVSGGTLALGSSLDFTGGVLSADSIAALNSRLSRFSGGSGPQTTVNTRIDDQLADSAYRLEVSAEGISIAGSDDEAVFHGAQSLLALVTPGSAVIPLVSVSDRPRFGYRGMHADIARNFHGVATLEKLIDQMSAYKLNRLHLHLSDDEGWRLQIPGLPELTAIGARRQFQLDINGLPTETAGLLPALGSGPRADNQGSGFLTRAEFVSLLRYARARYVDVIPELDMPGHARAAVVSMRARAEAQGRATDTAIRIDDPADSAQYLTIQHFRDGIINPCVEGTYTFIDTVVAEVKSMFDEAGMALDVWHMGGDEANNIFAGAGFQSVDPALSAHPWERSPACQALLDTDPQLNSPEDLTRYFVNRLAQSVSAAGIDGLYAYHDILSDIAPSSLATSRVGVSFWEILWSGGFSRAYDWPNRSFETVISSPDFLYFDFPYEVDPRERGYYWGTRFLDTRKVFSFAPENLPQNAETSLTRDGAGYTASGSVAYTGFTGMQAYLWSETVRTAEQFDYMVFPRLLAVAERAWHRAQWEIDYAPGVSYSNNTSQVSKAALNADWQRFANALGRKELAKLDAAGIAYRIPLAGAVTLDETVDTTTVRINSAFPGLALEFSSDGSNWQNYDPASPPATASHVRVRSADGLRVGREAAVAIR